MPSMDIISVNLWQIIISLCNLIILFLLLKKFLYKPVKKVLNKRQEEIDLRYADAEKAKSDAQNDKELWNEKINSAKEKSEEIIKDATVTAERRKEKIIDDAKNQADGILRQAQRDAEYERKSAEDKIRHEIVDVSSKIAEKVVERELSQKDHSRLIDSFLEKLEDDD